MSEWAFMSIILFIVIVILSYLLYRETKEKNYYQKEANREHCIRSALEDACNFPTLASEDFNEIEKLLEQIEKEVKEPYEYLSRVHEAIISLYKRKQRREG